MHQTIRSLRMKWLTGARSWGMYTGGILGVLGIGLIGPALFGKTPGIPGPEGFALARVHLAAGFEGTALAAEPSRSEKEKTSPKQPSRTPTEKPQPPRVSNRAPRANEMGYRPEDGSVVRLNPPSLLWLHEKEAQTYTVQWACKKDFSDAIMVTDIPWNTYTHHEPWAPGAYYWRYRFTTQRGEVSEWSEVRTLTVLPGATLFPMPTRAQQRERLPQGHPRLFVRPEDLPRLRDLAQGELAPLFKPLRERADQIIQAGPTPEPAQRGSVRDRRNAEAVKHWWPNRVQTEKACMEAEVLAFVYLLTGEKKYGEAARQWVLHLASWDPSGPTNFSLNCEAAKPMLFRPARAYDWAYPMFTHSEREKIWAVVQRRVHDAWVSWEVRQGVGHFTAPYNSHGNRTWHKIGEAGIAFLGEIPEAADWLDYAVNKFFACYPVWADEQGGWHEGLSYWAGYISKVVWWLQAMEVGLGIDWKKKPFFAHVADYALYVAPPGSPNSGFGDLSYSPPSAGWGPMMEFFCRSWANSPSPNHAPYWQWWQTQWKMRSADGIAGFLYAARLPPSPPPKEPTDLPPSQVFQGIGVASLHSNLLDSREDVHLLFKSSPFGTQSHGHNPHNTFQLNAYGAPLLTTCVYRDLHGSPFHYQWAHSTIAHNSVLVDGQGQTKHTAAPHGRIAALRLTPQWDHVVGEAAEAYEGRLVRFRRHVVLVKPSTDSPTPASSWTPFVVLYDDLEPKEPATFQFMLHGLRPFTIQEEKARLHLELDKAGVEVQYLSPVRLSFRQWDGYQPPPTQPFPNQWHVETGTQEKVPNLGMLTVIVPYRTGQPRKYLAERVQTNSALGVRITQEGKTVSVWFPKPGQPEPDQIRIEGL